MRILVLSNLYPPDVRGGYELACSQAVDGLIALGHDVQVLTADPRALSSTPPANHVQRRFQLVEDRDWIEPAPDLHDALLAARDAGSRFINAHNVRVLLDALRQFNPDVVYLHNLIGLGGLGLAAALQHLGIPWVWHLGDAVPRDLCADRRSQRPALVDAFNRSLRGHYLSCSQQLVDEIEAAGITLRGRVSVVPYWFVGDREAACQPTRIRDPDAPLRIMSAGLVNRQKGIDILIQSAARLRDLGGDRFVVDVYGRVADPGLLTMVRSLNLESHVRIRGPRPHAEILDLYGEYDLFAFPTRAREPFGIVPLEALARGCVPVVSRRCGVAEWLAHGVHCLKSARTPDAFARCFLGVLRGEVPLDPIAARGRSAAWSSFHLDAVLPRIESVLSASARSRTDRGPSFPRASEAHHLARLAERLAADLYCA